MKRKESHVPFLRSLLIVNMIKDSLQTAEAFPVVASLPQRETSDDRKCVCCSQARSKNKGDSLLVFGNGLRISLPAWRRDERRGERR